MQQGDAGETWTSGRWSAMEDLGVSLIWDLMTQRSRLWEDRADGAAETKALRSDLGMSRVPRTRGLHSRGSCSG